MEKPSGKRGASGKKRAKGNAPSLDKDALSKLFDEVWVEVTSESGRLSATAMPAPSELSRKSWRERAGDPKCPVMGALRELGAGAADSKAFIEALYRHGLADRRSTVDGDEPENALDGRCVLALLLGYFLAFQSEHVGKLFEAYPHPGTDDHTGLWHSVEVMSVPEGEAMPPLQKSIDALIVSEHVRACRKADWAMSKGAADVIGDLSYEIYSEIRTSPSAPATKKNILDLVYYLDGLSASIHDTIMPPVAEPEPVKPVELYANLLDLVDTPPPIVELAPVPEPSPSWAYTVKTEHVVAPMRPYFEEEDAFGARLRSAVEATNGLRKWRM